MSTALIPIIVATIILAALFLDIQGAIHAANFRQKQVERQWIMRHFPNPTGIPGVYDPTSYFPPEELSRTPIVSNGIGLLMATAAVILAIAVWQDKTDWEETHCDEKKESPYNEKVPIRPPIEKGDT